jgi:hypothetical protein
MVTCLSFHRSILLLPPSPLSTLSSSQATNHGSPNEVLYTMTCTIGSLKHTTEQPTDLNY